MKKKHLTAFLLGLVIAASARADAALAGDWIGWAYLHDGGDMPLRLRFEDGEDGLTGTLAAPVQRVSGLAVEKIVVDGERLSFTRVNSAGKVFAYTADLQGDAMEGETTLDGEPLWSFSMARARVALPDIDPERYADLVGLYRTAAGDAFLVSSWFWGELIFDDPATGRRRTMLARSDREFVLGAAMYDASAVDATLTFDRGPAGTPTSVTVRETDGATRTATRLELRETDVSFESAGAVLQGTLVLPPDDGPHPAVVIIGGSGWRGRDGTRAFGDLFASMGVAALCYDKRGSGASEGSEDNPFAVIAADAVAAARHLRRRDDVIASEVGLFGVSRGGWHVPLAASLDPETAFAVVFVGPAISPEAQETTRRLNDLRLTGVSAEELEEAAAYLRLLFDYASTGRGWDAYLAARADVERHGWLEILGGTDSDDEEAWRWSRMNMRYDPIPAIEATACPTLALFGGADENVVPAENVPLWREALTRGPCEDFTLHVVPDADHGFRLRPDNAGVPRVHDAPDRAAGVWPMVGAWLYERLGSMR